MPNAETQELLELIAHKLHYVAQKPAYLRISGLDPLRFNALTYPDVFGLQNLEAAGARIPQAAQILLVQLKGYGMTETLACLPQIMAISGLAGSEAAVNGRIIVLDDQVFAAADETQQLEILAEICYPKFFAFGHEGSAWTRLSL